nr:hypothetical protein [Parvibaculum sp.]
MPGAVKRHQRIALIIRGEGRALAEDEPQRHRAGREEEIGRLRRPDEIRPEIAELRIGVGAEIGVGKSVKGAGLHPRQVIGNEPRPESFALVDDGVEIVRIRIESHADRIAQARGEARLHLSVDTELLDGGPRARILADIGLAADGDEEMLAVGREDDLARDMTAAVAQRAGTRHHDARLRRERRCVETETPDGAPVDDVERAVFDGNSGRLAKPLGEDGRRFGNAVAVRVAQRENVAFMRLRDEDQAARTRRHFARPFHCRKDVDAKALRHSRQGIQRACRVFQLGFRRGRALAARCIGRRKIGETKLEMAPDLARACRIRRQVERDCRRRERRDENEVPTDDRMGRWKRGMHGHGRTGDDDSAARPVTQSDRAAQFRRATHTGAASPSQ